MDSIQGAVLGVKLKYLEDWTEIRRNHALQYSTALDKAGITANKNTVPFDTRPPFVASGIRLGTPAITTRGMKEVDMETVAEFIHQVFKNYNNDEKLAQIKKEVRKFCDNFPLYSELLK